MDCHDSANAESRNDGEICFKGKTALWIASLAFAMTEKYALKAKLHYKIASANAL